MSGDETKRPLQSLLRRVKGSYLLRFTLALFLIVAFISAVGAVVFYNINETLESDVQQQLNEETTAEAGQLHAWLVGNEQFTLSASNSPLLDNRTQHQSYVEDVVAGQLSDNRVSAVHVVDPVGRTEILASSNQTRRGDTADEAPWVELFGGVGPERVSTTRPYRNAGGDVVVASLSVPPQNPSLVVVVEFDATGVVEEFSSGIDGTFTEVVRPVPGSTQVLFSNSPSDTAFQPYVPETSQSEIQALVVAGPSAAFVSEPRKNKMLDDDHIASAISVEGTDWVLIKHAPRQTAYQLRQDITRAFVLFLVLAVVGTLVVGATLGRNTTRALRDAAEQAKRVEAGDYDQKIETDRNDEIGDLVDSIDGMRQTLQSHIQEIEQAHETATQHNEQLQVLDRFLRHNIRNRLNAVLINAGFIHDVGEANIRERAENIETMTEELLEKADKQRLITRALSPETEHYDIDLGAAIESAAASLRESYPDASITTTTESVAVEASPFLESAIRELLENALAHNDRSDPAVEIEVTQDGESARINVRDNGPQIPDAETAILTDASTIRPLEHGSGIGLWVVYWVVTQSNGQIQHQTLAPRGNEVTILLPDVDSE